MSADQEHGDVFVCSPQFDSLADGDKSPDHFFGIVDVQDIPETLEIYCLSSEACENKEQADILPSTSREVSKSKSSKKRHLSDDLSEWLKKLHPTRNTQRKETWLG
jgi:hypothetical protein